MKRLVLPALATLALSAVDAAAQPPVSPTTGSLVIVGGGRVGPEILGRFIELAGGADAPIVVIPTAGADSVYSESCACAAVLRNAGATNITVLHTMVRAVAETDSFVAPIRRAKAVWFPGGRQWRLADSYLGTRTERELHALLARGGVIGGTSAGATILGSYLVRGAPAGNSIMMSPGHEQGFAFLKNVGIDQHVLARGRLADLPTVLARYPDLLGIGIDEGTALVVQRDTAAVIGVSKVFVYGGKDAPDSAQVYRTLHPGDRYDLGRRTVIRR